MDDDIFTLVEILKDGKERLITCCCTFQEAMALVDHLNLDNFDVRPNYERRD